MTVRAVRTCATPFEGRNYSLIAGQVYDLPSGLVEKLQAAGFVIDYEPEDPATPAPPGETSRSVPLRVTMGKRNQPEPEVESVDETPAEDTSGEVDVDRYHVGGGWYELPDGERVRGKDAAAAAVGG